MCTSACLLQFQIELCRYLLKTTGHNAKYPIMHYFSTYGHIWSMKACMILTDSCWGFNPKLHCGNVDIMPYQKNIFRVLGAYYVDQVWDRLQAVDKKQKTKLNEHNRYACIPQQRQPLGWLCKKATCNVIHQFSSCWYYEDIMKILCFMLVWCICSVLLTYQSSCCWLVSERSSLDHGVR